MFVGILERRILTLKMTLQTFRTYKHYLRSLFMERHPGIRGTHTEKMSPVYICQNDKPMTSLALSTAHQVNTNLCQPHSLKTCHIFGKDLLKTCHPQYLFFAVDGSQVPI